MKHGLFSQKTVSYLGFIRVQSVAAKKLKSLTQIQGLAALGGLVDLHHYFHIPQTFFARYTRWLVGQDTLGKIIHFRGKLINVVEINCRSVTTPADDAAVAVGGVKFPPAIFGVSGEVIHSRKPVTGGALGDEAAGKFELPLDGFLHVLEFDRVGHS